MDRRDVVIHAGGLLVAAVTTGCTEERLSEAERTPEFLADLSPEEFDLPVPHRYEVAESAIQRASGLVFEDPAELDTYLTEHGVVVEDLVEADEAGEPILSLRSIVDDWTERGFMEHLGLVAGGYAALIAGGHDSERSMVSLLDTDRRRFGEYEVRRHWAEDYLDGSISPRTYADEIAVTASSR